MKSLLKHIDSTSKAYGTQINAERTKIMANNSREDSTNHITVSVQAREAVSKFKCVGAIVAD